MFDSNCLFFSLHGSHLTTDKGFQRQGSKHVDAETKARNVDDKVVGWKVVQYIA